MNFDERIVPTCALNLPQQAYLMPPPANDSSPISSDRQFQIIADEMSNDEMLLQSRQLTNHSQNLVSFKSAKPR
ncbi:MAG: hypothetical protein IPN36_05045 [Bacteroidetes bacterium]|nr:hypothetical protein [Bacteroidota bacterium]